MDGNYIKFYRKFLEWEWWDDINTSRLFIFMLLKANWKDGNFKGLDIPKGSFVSSIAKLSDGTKLTCDEVRTALKHLKSTNEITSKSHSKFTVFTIKNYCSYQQVPEQITEQFPSSSQAVPEQVPSKSHAIPTLFPTIEEVKKERREEEEEKKEGKKGNKKSSTAEDMEALFQKQVSEKQISQPLIEKIQDWLKYKTERKELYKEQGMKSLITTISKHANKYGDIAVIDLIDECMASGWVGIIWDRIDNKKQKGSAYMESIKNRVSEVDNWV